jgi:excisionase family DNA binding protein
MYFYESEALMMTQDQVFLSTQEVAKRLNVNPRTVNRMIERGELPAYKVSGVLRIDEQELHTYLEKNRTQPKKEDQ